MKTVTQSFLVLFLSLLCLCPLRAQTFEFDGLNYEIVRAENVTNVVVTDDVIVTGFADGVVKTDLTILHYVIRGDTHCIVTAIDANAFYNCTGLRSVTLPPLIDIGAFAFYGVGLTSVAFSLPPPPSLADIGEYAFAGCSMLPSVTLPAGLTDIGNCVFYGCGMLSSVTLPAGLATIGNYAFAGCGMLTSVSLQSTTPPTLGANAFASVASGYIHLPGRVPRRLFGFRLGALLPNHRG
jgi:hypothetical protein